MHTFPNQKDVYGAALTIIKDRGPDLIHVDDVGSTVVMQAADVACISSVIMALTVWAKMNVNARKHTG